MQSGVSRADKSRLDVGNRERGGKRASREGAAGNVGEVGFQDQVRGAAVDRRGPEGGKGGEEEAQSPNVVGATDSQETELKTKPGEVKQSSGGGVTGKGMFRRDSHTSGGSDLCPTGPGRGNPIRPKRRPI